jgi:hypothetical protein
LKAMGVEKHLCKTWAEFCLMKERKKIRKNEDRGNR